MCIRDRLGLRRFEGRQHWHEHRRALFGIGAHTRVLTKGWAPGDRDAKGGAPERARERTTERQPRQKRGSKEAKRALREEVCAVRLATLAPDDDEAEHKECADCHVQRRAPLHRVEEE
eukprot:6191007-Pleurochrysis_carterae.AAC.1